jgi:hypothetical protein
MHGQPLQQMLTMRPKRNHEQKFCVGKRT